MLLAVDVGNTNIVFGLHDGATWLKHWRVRTVRDKMPDEYGVLFRDFLRTADVALDALEQVVISSVVPPITDRMEEMLSTQTGIAPLTISAAVKTGLAFAIDNPAELGADLIADGGRRLRPRARCVHRGGFRHGDVVHRRRCARDVPRRCHRAGHHPGDVGAGGWDGATRRAQRWYPATHRG